MSRRSPLAAALLALVHLYRATLGRVLGGSCRFHPSCSEFALEAIRANGGIVGGLQAVGRVFRCGPWSRGGIDYPRRRRETLQGGGNG